MNTSTAGIGKRGELWPVKKAVKAPQDKNFGLTGEEFSALALALRHGDETLFQQVFLAHFSECMRQLSRYEGFTHAEAYDAAMDAMLHFRQLIIDEKVYYGNLTYLFTTVARQLYTKRTRKQLVTTQLAEQAEIADCNDEVEFSEEDFQGLKRAISHLGEDCQSLLRSFYFERITLNDLATRHDRKPAAVRKQKSRCVTRLRNFFILQRN